MIRVLYVEDNEDSAYMLKMRLELIGDFDVTLARNGQEGIDKAIEDRPDIVLMDMDLPVLSGRDAMRILKTDLRTASMPIVALTAHAMEGTRKTALEEGFDEYCVKPVDFEELLTVVRKLARSGRTPA